MDHLDNGCNERLESSGENILWVFFTIAAVKHVVVTH